jgi:hypothetical protein
MCEVKPSEINGWIFEKKRVSDRAVDEQQQWREEKR